MDILKKILKEKAPLLSSEKIQWGGVLSVEASPSGSVFTNGILRARIQSIPSRIANLFESKYDEAMNAPDVHASKQPYDGGIDLNSRNMAMTVKGEKIDMRFDPAIEAQFKRGDFSGVRAVIVGITSIPSVLQLMNN